MRLCIADPPYLGNGEMLYGAKQMDLGRGKHAFHKADVHPEAHIWDDPATHEALVLRLMQEYDGWAIAMLPAALRYYLRWVPETTRIAVWHDPMTMPTGAHPRRRWEAVLLYRAPGRKRVDGVPAPVGDVLIALHVNKKQRSFAGEKPRAWTRWVLDMLGYDPDSDTVDDLFHGSGSVAAEVAQQTLRLEM